MPDFLCSSKEMKFLGQIHSSSNLNTIQESALVKMKHLQE
jgi:hypothetical protein